MSDPITCQRVGCEHPAKWRPVLACRAKGYEQHPAPATLSLVVCDAHKAESTVDYFITDAGWKQISDSFDAAGLMRPERSLTTLDWIEATEENAPRKAFAKAMAPRPSRNPFQRS